MSKYTRWFFPKTKPARIGVYQTSGRRRHEAPMYQRWNGRFWEFACGHPATTSEFHGMHSNFQNEYWRGLAKKP